MAITLKDVAELAGVSPSAVSRCYTDGASISKGTRLKVEDAAQQLGYSPNALASSLTTGRTKMVGVVSNNFHNPIFLEVFDRVTRDLQERDLRPLLVNLTDVRDPSTSVQMLQQYSVDAVIVASSTLPVSFAETFAQAGMKVVHAFGRLSDAPGVNVLGIDNQEAGRIAARTLVARGYTRLGMMGGPETATTTHDRFMGFTAELEKHPEVTFSTSFASAYSFDAGRDGMARMLQNGSRAEAYFCGDDVLSIGALAAIKDAGLRVPEDIGIIGLNNMEIARWDLVNLTTICNPVAEIVAAAVELVSKILDEDDTPPRAIKFPTRVVERGTLRPLI